MLKAVNFPLLLPCRLNLLASLFSGLMDNWIKLLKITQHECKRNIIKSSLAWDFLLTTTLNSPLIISVTYIGYNGYYVVYSITAILVYQNVMRNTYDRSFHGPILHKCTKFHAFLEK